MTDKETITKYLNTMNTELKKYPKGFFKEFNEMNLTIFLINSVPNKSFSGFTDKEFLTDVKITLTDELLFSYTMHHEIMHYIDAYLETKMYPSNPYDEYVLLNPVGFTYGNVESNYSYSTNRNNAYFINDYAQYNYLEDRAKLFEQMIGRVYKPTLMFDDGSPLKAKALVIDK